MSRIKENLIGYEYDGWCELDMATMVDELTEYDIMSMSILQVKQELQDAIKDRYRQYTKDELQKEYEGVFGNE